jgi:Ca-activated chloride channel homolog
MLASLFLKSCLKFFLILLPVIGVFESFAFTQTELDDIHIAPRSVTAGLSAGANGLAAGLHVIKRDTNLVLVPVSVVDSMERIVVGLRPDNFRVFEGNKAQAIRHFSSEDAPVSVGIILDASGSMRNKMEIVREAVHQFCSAANVDDEFFMITFADTPRMAGDFSKEPAQIEEQLLYTHAAGRTALLDAIYMGLHKMKEAQYPRKALLIISDGGDNHSRYSERDIQAAVKESEVVVYSIGTFDRNMPTTEERLGPGLLSSIAEPTGGRAFTITNPMELPEVALLVGAELRTQYVLGYRPEDMPHDGKWHKIRVKLKAPRHLGYLNVHAKSGYYAATR